jgi:hypothetical protein
MCGSCGGTPGRWTGGGRSGNTSACPWSSARRRCEGVWGKAHAWGGREGGSCDCLVACCRLSSARRRWVDGAPRGWGLRGGRRHAGGLGCDRPGSPLSRSSLLCTTKQSGAWGLPPPTLPPSIPSQVAAEWAKAREWAAAGKAAKNKAQQKQAGAAIAQLKAEMAKLGLSEEAAAAMAGPVAARQLPAAHRQGARGSPAAEAGGQGGGEPGDGGAASSAVGGPSSAAEGEGEQQQDAPAAAETQGAPAEEADDWEAMMDSGAASWQLPCSCLAAAVAAAGPPLGARLSVGVPMHGQATGESLGSCLQNALLTHHNPPPPSTCRTVRRRRTHGCAPCGLNASSHALSSCGSGTGSAVAARGRPRGVGCCCGSVGGGRQAAGS